MPLYDYQCSACQFKAEEFQKMSSPHLTVCPACHQSTYKRCITAPHTNLKEFHTPIEMHSIALNHDDDIAEFRRRCPGVEVSSDPNDPQYGIPVARNRQQKVAALKAAGFHERN